MPKAIAFLRPHNRMFSKTTPHAKNLFEYRLYHLHPDKAPAFAKKVASTADLRKSLVPLRLFTLPETGGELHVASHLYFYKDGMEERNAARAASQKNADWLSAVNDTRPDVRKQYSSIYNEAPQFVLDAAQCSGGDFVAPNSNPGIFEVRRYKLILGYDTVPAFMDMYAKGVEAKVLAGQDEGTKLQTLMYNEIGELNEVIEIWRHEGVNGMARSRAMAREAGEWKEAVGGIAKIAKSFTNTIHTPLVFSPWR